MEVIVKRKKKIGRNEGDMKTGFKEKLAFEVHQDERCALPSKNSCKILSCNDPS